MARLLADYLGLWTVRRSIIDRLNSSVVRFEGMARVISDRFEEQGLAHHRNASLQSSRAYGLEDGTVDVGAHFVGGGEFIRISSAPSQRVVHLCGDDLYRGRLFFRSPDAWAEYWHVTGPRKHYVSLARYDRAKG